MRKGDVWSLKVKDSEGLHPLVVITDIKDAETIEVTPLFSGDENATHMDRLLYPYQEWLMGDDWAAIRLKEDIPSSNLRSYLDTLPEIIVDELDKELKGEKSYLPKGFFMIEGLGDEREQFQKDLALVVEKAKTQQFKEIILKKIKEGWNALNATIEEVATNLAITGAVATRGAEKTEDNDALTSLSIKAENFDAYMTLKKTGTQLRIMNINGDFNNVYAKTDKGDIFFKKIGDVWIPERTLFFEEADEIIIDDTIIKTTV